MPALLPPESAAFADWMRRGTQLHADGQLEQALTAFENARAIDPASTHAASATATLLSALSRPAAAYKVLQGVESLLLEDADGAANLAIAAETCGDLDRAKKIYECALALNSDHLRSLNNLGLLAAAQSQWSLAVSYAERCVAVDPAEPSYRHNLADFLAGACCYAQALTVLEAASQRFPEHLDIMVRRIAVLAFLGEFEKSHALAATLDGPASVYLQSFVSPMLNPSDQNRLRNPAPLAYDPLPLFTGQVFKAMSTCDWRNNGKLSAILREALALAADTGQNRDFRDVLFYAPTLDLNKSDLAQMHQMSHAAPGSALPPRLPVFRPLRKVGARIADSRIHVGLAVPSLANPLQRLALQRELALHNLKRFAIHVYASTHQPDLAHGEALRANAASVVETAHFSDEELAARIRLDQLDVFVDIGFASSGFRPEVLAIRIAPVQIRQLSWPSPCPARLYDYSVSDRFIHPDNLDLSQYGPLLRFPHTCWLAVNSHSPGAASPLWASSLPVSALVFCSFFEPASLDLQSFSAWMEILTALPDALFYLPGCTAATAVHLAREAASAGVDPARLIFSQADSSPVFGCTRLPDLFLDPLRISAARGLEEALRMGVPALSCAGDSVASRMGGSMLHAASLPECVLGSQQAYIAEAVRLGGDANARRLLRERLLAVTPNAALFNVQARVREREEAWAWMTVRAQSGLPSVAMDL